MIVGGIPTFGKITSHVSYSSLFFPGFLSEDIFLGNSHIYPPDPANYVLAMEKPRLFLRKSTDFLRGKILIGAIHSAHV